MGIQMKVNALDTVMITGMRSVGPGGVVTATIEEPK